MDYEEAPPQSGGQDSGHNQWFETGENTNAGRAQATSKRAMKRMIRKDTLPILNSIKISSSVNTEPGLVIQAKTVHPLTSIH
jgi:hypothetical protein